LWGNRDYIGEKDRHSWQEFKNNEDLMGRDEKVEQQKRYTGLRRSILAFKKKEGLREGGLKYCRELGGLVRQTE